MDKSKRVKGDFEDGGHIDKTQVLQEAKQNFMANSFKTKELCVALTKCIYILLQGERLTNIEATDLFFHITRLFQYKDKDNTLRRLTYIAIKALSQQAENVYVVTSSLTTDINSFKDDPAVRASALRALCQISDASTFTCIEHYLRQSVVDKHPVVASAALTSLIRISQVNSEIVRRCTNEIQEALYSDSPMVQYHALTLRYFLCKDDRLATSTLLTTCINQGLKSPLAICLLIRILANYINELPDDEETNAHMAYIRDFLEHPSEMVEYEAARAIINMTVDKSKKQNKLMTTRALSHMRNFLSAHKSALRFTSVRLLNGLAATSSTDVRFWSVHRIGTLCQLHLLEKRYKPGDDIIGVLDFSNSSIVCAKYTCMLQCEEYDLYETRSEFSMGFRRNDFMIKIPRPDESYQPGLVFHAILSFIFYIADQNIPKSLYEDKAGRIELGPSELDTKLFSCDFPVAIYI